MNETGWQLKLTVQTSTGSKIVYEYYTIEEIFRKRLLAYETDQDFRERRHVTRLEVLTYKVTKMIDFQ